MTPPRTCAEDESQRYYHQSCLCSRTTWPKPRPGCSTVVVARRPEEEGIMTHSKLGVALGLGLEASVGAGGEPASGGGEGAAGDEGGHIDGCAWD